MARVELNKVSKVYNEGTYAVDSASIVINDEEFVVFVGPSGCGKSTTLRMIAGLEEISKGDLYIDDKRVNDVEPKDRNIAMVFQNYALYPHMSVYENMAFALKIRKMNKKEIDKKIRSTAKILDIENLLQRKPKALSGGQRQRVAVGRAIVRDPKVFLFDEPLSNLDAKLRVQMRAEISNLHKKLKATMIYVTHDQVEAMTMGDKIVVMKDGIVQQIGSPLQLYHHPANKFVAGFIGTPLMNFLQVKVNKTEQKIFLEEETFRLDLNKNQQRKLRDYAGEFIYLGIRPEDIKLSEKTKEKNSIKMKILFKEILGTEVHLHVSGKTQKIIARIFETKDYDENSKQGSLKIGSSVHLAIDMEKAKFFNLETELAI